MDKMACNTSSKANQKDHISHLPDGILEQVLSRLAMKEAARTSVLSCRWKNIWKSYTGCFHFDATDMIILVLRRKIFGSIGADKYVFWVNQVLDSHQGQTIEELHISFDLDRDFTNHINRWIDFANARRVQRLELDLSPTSDNSYRSYYPHKSTDDRHIYRFPTWLLNFPLGVSDFDALTSLRLKSVDLTEEVVLHFLSNCQMLEHLSLDYSPSLQNLKFVGPSLKLKHLEITNCLELKNLYISARNLIFFKYEGPEINMLFRDVPKLSSVSLRGHYSRLIASKANNLPFSLSQIEMLALDPPVLDPDNKYDITESLPELTNLRELEFKFKRNLEPSVLCLNAFIHASPHLQKLVIKYESTEKIRFRREFMRYPYVPGLKENKGQLPRKCKHQCLKEVEFFGWDKPEVYFDLLKHLIELATSLERITVDPCYRHDLVSMTPPRTDEENQVARLARQLEPVLEGLSRRTKLVIL